MKFYKKSVLLFFILFFCNTILNAESLNINGALNNVKRDLLGPSLVPVNDPRVVGLIVAGVLGILCAGLINYAVFSEEKETEQKSSIKKVLAFIAANGFYAPVGLFTIFFSRAAVTAIDEISYKALQELNNSHVY
jgi:hypothetical protein